MDSRQRRVGVLLLLPLIGALSMAACGGGPAPAVAPAAKPATVTAPVKEAELTTVKITPEAEKRLGVVTVLVEEKTVARTRTVGGEIVPASGSTMVITAPVAGAVQSPGSALVAGTVVTQGQVLFRLVPIQPSERDAAVDAQQAADTATARRDNATRRVQRAEQLTRDGAGSRRALEDAQAELAVAEAELAGARARAALAGQSGAVGGGVNIEAPDTAVVQSVHGQNGQTVAANTPLVDLIRLATVWLRVPVYAGEVADIDPAQAARVVGLGEPATAEGVRAAPVAAPPSANATTAGVDLYFSLANPDRRFRPGERVGVRLTRRNTAASLVVPKAALLHDAYGGTWVYVVREPGVYVRRRVAVSDISGPLAILSQGPPAGARVVTDGAAELFGVEFGAGK